MTIMFRGKPACTCLVAWLPVYERELLRLGVIRYSIDIYQLIGTAKASVGTHTGGAFDIAQTQAMAIWVARQMGADATWERPKNWDGKNGIAHTHGVLRGCPHNHGGQYQIDAVDKGYNGLGSGGMGGRDTGPRPLSGRTWREGVDWAKRRQAAAERIVLDLTVATANVTDNPRHDSTIESDLKKIEKAGVDLVMWQEMAPVLYKQKLLGLKRLKSVLPLGMKTAYSTPISYCSTKLKEISSNATIAQPGTPKVTPRRHLTTVRFRATEKPKVKVVARSGHQVAKAFRNDGSKKPRPKRSEALQQPMRQAIWFAGKRVYMHKVKRDAKKGLPQVIGLDANRKRVPLINRSKVKRRRVQVVPHQLDWLIFIDGADHAWELVGTKELISIHSPHKVLVQRARLVEKKK